MKLRKIFDDNISMLFLYKNRLLLTNSLDNTIIEYDIQTDNLVCVKKNLYKYLENGRFAGVYQNYFIIQKGDAYYNGIPAINEIQVIDGDNEMLFLKYNYDILMADWIKDGFFFSHRYLGEQVQFFLFNPITKEEKWNIIFDKKDDIRYSIFDNIEDFFVLSSNVTLQVYCYSKQTGIVLWQTNLSFLRKDINDEPCRIDTIKYNTVAKQIVIYFGGTLLGLDALTGFLKWQIEKSLIRNAIIDPLSGNIIYKGTHLDYLDRKSSVLYVLNSEGQIVSKKRFTVDTLKIADLYPERTSYDLNDRFNFLGVYGHYFYLTLSNFCLLYKIDIRTLQIKDVYKHEYFMYGYPEFYENKLIIKDVYSYEEGKERLLIFELNNSDEASGEALQFPLPSDVIKVDEVDLLTLSHNYQKDDDLPF